MLFRISRTTSFCKALKPHLHNVQSFRKYEKQHAFYQERFLSLWGTYNNKELIGHFLHIQYQG